MDERELARQNAALQKENLLLGMVAHDLRTPLGVIHMSAALLQHGGDGPLAPGQIHHLERIERSAEFMIRLVGDLLDLATLDSGERASGWLVFDVPARHGQLVLRDLDKLTVGVWTY